MRIPDSRLNSELSAVFKEYDYSQRKWEELDKLNGTNDYITWCVTYLGTAGQVRTDQESRYAAFIKVANLALTAAMRLRTGTMPEGVSDQVELASEIINSNHNEGRAFK